MERGRGKCLGASLIIAALALSVLPASSGDGDPRKKLLTPKTEAAIERGLSWLARHQQRRGHWLAPKRSYGPGIAALCGLAFLASGDGVDQGQHHQILERLLRYLLDNQLSGAYRGLLYDRGLPVAGQRPMHGHGLALLFLAEVYGQLHEPEQRARAREAIASAVALSLTGQGERGGWYYLPGSKKDEGSVTVTQIQALRAARNAGFAVPRAAIDRAVTYVKRSQDRYGGVRYTLDSGAPSQPLTAAGAVVFQGAEAHGEALDQAYRYLDRFIDDEDQKRQHFYFYHHFYASQAFHRRKRGFPSYFRRVRDQLLERQAGDGRWRHKVLGDPYATAMACLILQVPRGYLPIFQR